MLIFGEISVAVGFSYWLSKAMGSSLIWTDRLWKDYYNYLYSMSMYSLFGEKKSSKKKEKNHSAVALSSTKALDLVYIHSTISSMPDG